MKQSVKAFTLVEILVVVSIIVLLMAVAMPNIPGMMRSNKMSGAKNLITTALAQAQSYAASHSKYAGIRFQKAANGRTYLVLIEHDPQFPWNNGSYLFSGYHPYRFVAVPNASPKALPEGVGAVDGVVGSVGVGAFFANAALADTYLVDYSSSSDGVQCIENFQTFSIVFSPNGHLVTKEVQIQPRRTDLGFLFDSGGLWFDSIFGPSEYARKEYNPEALLSYDYFYDYYDYIDLSFSNWSSYPLSNLSSTYGIDCEPLEWCKYDTDTIAGEDSGVTDQFESSRKSLFIYMENELAEVSPDSRYTNYFSVASSGSETIGCEHIMVNIYTGSIIDE